MGGWEGEGGGGERRFFLFIEAVTSLHETVHVSSRFFLVCSAPPYGSRRLPYWGFIDDRATGGLRWASRQGAISFCSAQKALYQNCCWHPGG